MSTLTITEPACQKVQVINLIGRANKSELCSTESGSVSILRTAIRCGKDGHDRDVNFVDVTAFENCREEPWQTTIG